MSRQTQNLRERRNKTNQLVNHMLAERKQLLSLLLRVSALKEEQSDNDRELLDEFCQVLVDYIAAGHFGLYDRIIKRQERRKNVSDLALEIYPGIDRTTQTVLSFNEKYNPDQGARKLADLHMDLSALGEDLAARIELEDSLINCLIKPAQELRN